MHKVVWVCDPMHGNTFKSAEAGVKTRSFDAVLSELRETCEIHRRLGSRLGGVHFELTGENVTECTGGPQDLAEADLPMRFATLCDPRLNYAQSIEVAFRLADYVRQARSGGKDGAGGGAPPSKRARLN